MNLKLNKKSIKKLSLSGKKLDKGNTPLVGGGAGACSGRPNCVMDDQPYDTATSTSVPVTF
ncbi:hypothetical protein A7985_11450 [Pseudoalteromonas luteoviolacea]|uniref:Uncharacterized protein n=1 Tax=Pseudoalteromonas luteoviolacea TaxID=43657 RepID=A0A1C0TQL1_9GAMM|nr:hypothetical protein [Pseudoalteromonas luteoviolacea]MBQ4811479.1 hypothetical protein [Pseudoalteromonas luteoviolacea]OCQ21236.1 hypothetical protein A7985_11450 [Pseudoalteromonas luteoviolacea]